MNGCEQKRKIQGNGSAGRRWWRTGGWVAAGVFAAQLPFAATVPAAVRHSGATHAAAANPFRIPRAIILGSQRERRREMRVLGIRTLRAGKNAVHPHQPNFANYTEAKANPYPKLPPLMRLNDGMRVTTLAQWRERRRQIRALFAEYVYGKKPKDVPKVTWRVVSVRRQEVYGVPAVVEHVVGYVDNAMDPHITVRIPVNVVTPAAAAGRRVPVIIGGGTLHPFFANFHPVRKGPILYFPGSSMCIDVGPPTEPSGELLLRRGWGFVSINLRAVQPDNGADLDIGIIGLTDKGRPRKMDAWGVLRAWAWAIDRTVSFLQKDPAVNPHAIGVMGHSRNGKAALLALAYDRRIAVGYISSSGKGGAVLYRRNYGENIGSLTSWDEFQWFDGNFLRYASPGYTANDLPVDSDELIALVAPRAIFVGSGSLLMHPACAIPGDGWEDPRGSFMALAAASPAWRLYGERGLGRHTPFPPVDTQVGSRYAAFRQQPYGHTPAPNWPYFIKFAARLFAARK